MTYQIENESDLIKALKECMDGDVLESYNHSAYRGNHIVDKKIHLSGIWNIETRDKVGVEKHQPFMTITKGAEISGQFYGDMVKNPTDWRADGLQTCFRADGASYLNVDGAIIKYFNYMGVHLFDCTLANFNRCAISDCATSKEKYGFGYGIWQGGKGNGYNQVLNVNGCDFTNNRHCIAGSKHPNHIYVSDCDFEGGEFSQHILDRHGEDQVGGGNYFIIGNRFHAEDRFAYDLAKPGFVKESEECEIRIEGNTFARPFGAKLINGILQGGNGRIGGVIESELIATFKNNIYKS